MAQHVRSSVAAADRDHLEAIVADRNLAQKHVARAWIILGAADRLTVAGIARRDGVGRTAVWRPQRRYAETGIDGLLRDKTRKPGKAPLAEELVHALQPHWNRTFKRWRDPDFLAKLEDIDGLCTPRRCTPCCCRSTRRAKSRPSTAPSQAYPSGRPGWAGTMTRDHKRYGIPRPSLCSTCWTAPYWVVECSGTTIGVTPLPQRRRGGGPAGQLIHAIMDNHDTHKHLKLMVWLRWTFLFHARLKLVAERRRDLSLGDDAAAPSGACSAGSSTFRRPSAATSQSTTTLPRNSPGPNL